MQRVEPASDRAAASSVTRRSRVDASTLSWLLALVGLAVAVYLAVVHYANGAVPLACSDSGLVNCDLVTSSPQAYVGPAPVAVLGVVWFLVELALLSLERARPSGAALAVQSIWSASGVLFVLYLVYAELFLIGALCAWCTVVHVVVILLFLLALWRLIGAPVAAPAHHPARD
jgi:uncharacterized membrane protein